MCTKRARTRPRTGVRTALHTPGSRVSIADRGEARHQGRGSTSPANRAVGLGLPRPLGRGTSRQSQGQNFDEPLWRDSHRAGGGPDSLLDIVWSPSRFSSRQNDPAVRSSPSSRWAPPRPFVRSLVRQPATRSRCQVEGADQFHDLPDVDRCASMLGRAQRLACSLER